MLVLLPRRPRTPIATRCNLIRITMLSTSIHTNKFGVPLGFMTRPRTEHRFYHSNAHQFHLNRPLMATGKRWPRRRWQILSFVVVLSTIEFHSELLLLFCLFHHSTTHSAYMAREIGEKTTATLLSALTSYGNMAKLSRKNNSAAGMVSEHSQQLRESFPKCRQLYTQKLDRIFMNIINFP